MMIFQLLLHSSPSLFMSFSALQDLQGDVESYFLTIETTQSSQVFAFSPEVISTVISELWPSTTYLVSLQVSNGAHNTTKAIVNVTTEDGGMCLCLYILYFYFWPRIDLGWSSYFGYSICVRVLK